MGNIYPAKLHPIQAVRTGVRASDASRKSREELKEKIGNWKKKAWLDFCKLLMAEDKRYTLMPLTDYNSKAGTNTMMNRVQNADGVFANFCLTRTGEMSDIYLLPCDPILGVKIDAGSKYSTATIQGFPSKAMVWPIIRIADELERQYVREVSIEATKHGTGRLGNGTNSGVDRNSDVDKLPTDSETNG